MINLNDLPKTGEAVVFENKGASINMTVINVRLRYGMIDVEVTPVSGSGSFWTEYRKVKKTTPIEAALQS